jgi:hypothetical protein
MGRCDGGCGCWCRAGVSGGWCGFGRGRVMGCRGGGLVRGGWVVLVCRVVVCRVVVVVVGRRWCVRMR